MLVILFLVLFFGLLAVGMPIFLVLGLCAAILYFGEGTGEAFFMGPYLDVLPSAVTKWTADAAQ